MVTRFLKQATLGLVAALAALCPQAGAKTTCRVVDGKTVITLQDAARVSGKRTLRAPR